MWPMKRMVLCIVALCMLPLVVAAQSVDEILAKVYTARGGLERIHSVKSQRITGEISVGSDSGPFAVELERPLKMHMQLTVQNLTMVRVYDGKSAGWANNPFAGKMNPDAMTADDLKNISEESDFDGPLVDYKQKGNKIELIGKDKVGDTDVWRLRLTNKNGDVRFYLFDANSFLLLKWEGQREDQGKQYPIESFFHDYRDVDGLKMSFEIDSGAPGSQPTQRLRIEKIELNPVLSDSEFAKPATPATPDAPATAPSAPPPSR